MIAHRLTDGALAELAATDWSDEALEARVEAGERSPRARGEHQEGDARTPERSVARADTGSSRRDSTSNLAAPPSRFGTSAATTPPTAP